MDGLCWLLHTPVCFVLKGLKSAVAHDLALTSLDLSVAVRGNYHRGGHLSNFILFQASLKLLVPLPWHILLAENLIRGCLFRFWLLDKSRF